MNKFKELPLIAQIGLAILAGVLIFVAGWYGPYPGLADMKAKNEADTRRLEQKRAENNKLRPYEGKLAALDAQIATLQVQMERQKKIVPDAKDADNFIREMEAAASSAGIEIRDFNALPVTAKQYYTEVPFGLELDGPYYSMLNFFERVAGMERIVNVDGLRMASINAKTGSPVRRRYEYAPSETVAVACVAKTFYSKPANVPAAPAPAPPAPR